MAHEKQNLAEEIDSGQKNSPEDPLERLSNAFSALLSTDQAPADEESADAAADEQDPVDAAVAPEPILEAMLFVGTPTNEAMSARYLASLMRGVTPREVEEMVASLNRRYEEDGCPYEIRSETTGFKMALRESFGRVRDKVFGRSRRAKLSQAAVDVLAIVAYNQPISAEDVTSLRGASSGGLLTQLVRRQLLRIERPPEDPRKPLYHTTDRFLRLFNLQSLSELPRDEDLEKN